MTIEKTWCAVQRPGVVYQVTSLLHHLRHYSSDNCLESALTMNPLRSKSNPSYTRIGNSPAIVPQRSRECTSRRRLA